MAAQAALEAGGEGQLEAGASLEWATRASRHYEDDFTAVVIYRTSKAKGSKTAQFLTLRSMCNL